jgi:thioredoxin reductase
MYEVIIVGGSSAGLSSALVLGRSRRRVLVIDSGKPCNRFSHASHGFLTRDGIDPQELVQLARDQLQRYETVKVRDGFVTQITREEADAAGFRVETESGESFTSRRVLLATGLKDELPLLPGIEAFWGKSVFHCPYCDGWEFRDQPIVVHGQGEGGFHKTILLRQWTNQLTWCTDEGDVSDEQRDRLTRHGIRVIETKISRLEGTGEQIERIVFEDGSTNALKAMFVSTKLSHPMPFAEQLGCKVSDSGIVEIDLLGHTSVPGVYAAGDLSSHGRSVAIAVAQGSSAGAGINMDLIGEDFA